MSGIFVGSIISTVIILFDIYQYYRNFYKGGNNNDTSKNEDSTNETKIHVVDISPLELRKRFDNKGYVIIMNNLATINTELNEFVELMRRTDLHILNGCKDPRVCNCTFRHKRCRLFMIRKSSNNNELNFFAPSCSGVTNISPSNKDIKNGTPIHEFVQLFQNKFCDRVMDLVNYVNYIIDPDRQNEYIVDITLIADPYNIYQDNETNDVNCIIEDEKNTIHETQYFTINNMKKCSLKWHQDKFIEANTNQSLPYDYVAMFILDAYNLTPHKIMIGKMVEDNINSSKISLNENQENILLLNEKWIDELNNSDIGYIIDQKRGYLHKHSDYSYNGKDSRRNIITIRIKHFDKN